MWHLGQDYWAAKDREKAQAAVDAVAATAVATTAAAPAPKKGKKSILKSADTVKNQDYKRNISWQDQYGQALCQVCEFEPSDHPDSDYDELEERGCCAVM
ncbi:hypothetical protein TSOC_007060 [Tetrabaena socialis]|uniref:Uncharacterized protein n=1 Tax=Tetrabaena socialis TaxID=47790 RepID=A0A2J8A1Y0_9CHLO|nr:hypothetical protein TSOC_007060 [Tetrabaena socialis]|eukprot:PNH06551.1 hypothetical protein TSOC_007060 [Tetrabaena socialis]